MEGNEVVKMIVPSSQLTNVDVSGDGDGERQYSFPEEIETFYLKLTHLLNSSGLTLIINVRETSLNLFEFYLEVVKRGGYKRVCKQKEWGEVVSALKLEGNNAKLPSQIKKLYANLLYEFEKIYFYRFRATQTATHTTKALPERLLQAPSNDKEKKKPRGVPRGANGYQIFLKHECARLKACRQDINGKAILPMAVEGWKNLSEIDKQPYVEESKKIKEAMIIDNNKHKGKEKIPSICGDYYYCVTSQPQGNYSFANSAALDLAFKITEKTSMDPFFLCDLDAYRSGDLLSLIENGEI
ncbi:unnamed protein product [Lathyrus oleraceus]|uniref:Uncharacterized protein n=1 Tax=Pisum sativum TaxID=3888 RepID=A0A9D4YBU3_PEA|nr:uncharacterized protein LOC127121142 [Pisum sativum]KAI5434340.1 hypothetical protein KIW84_021264 [Pisum sativum]